MTNDKQEDVSFVRMTPDDLEVAFDIEKEAEKHSPFTREEMRECLEKEIVYGARVENSVAGYIAYVLQNNGEAYIGSLMVKPEFQRRGLGRALMRRALEELRGCKRIYLTVRPENISAVGLYKSVGFREVGLVEKYYRDGKPRLILEIKRI